MSHQNEDRQFVILRCFTVYGPSQRPDLAYYGTIDVQFSNQPINIYGDGTQSQTNTLISDCVKGTILGLEGSSSNQIVNISGSNSITHLEAIT
jgi:nucleoside-diphosphate-sugar epimerase